VLKDEETQTYILFGETSAENALITSMLKVLRQEEAVLPELTFGSWQQMSLSQVERVIQLKEMTLAERQEVVSFLSNLKKLVENLVNVVQNQKSLIIQQKVKLNYKQNQNLTLVKEIEQYENFVETKNLDNSLRTGINVRSAIKRLVHSLNEQLASTALC